VSEASSVRFTVQRKTTGRRVGASCAAQTRANRTKRACTRWVAVKGSFTIPATAGSNSVTFRGRIGGTTLKPGSYRLNSQASDTAGNASAIKRQSFRIVK
jgi:allophanate hydrolase subunit 2